MIQTKTRQPRGGFYWTCPECGATLDSGEYCNCKKKPKDEEAPADPAELVRIIQEFSEHEQ